ncbi:hypothetical protein [Niameybacter massiliensis]|uniref:hypothetical protein n=1 Tax=Niameybacter massiliensis TaxID=1658108 RepID=UPI0006B59553|nr:hypothetical protein [Niameybacter massiliensis]
MMCKIKYSALTYYPSFLLTDNTTIGVAFHNLSTNERRFEITSNITRIANTYDELNPDILKIILHSIKESICKDSSYSFNNTETSFDLYDFTKFYVNEFKFTPIVEVDVENFDSFIDEAKKIYLRYDYSKEQRPSVGDEIKFLKHIISSKKNDCSSKPLFGEFNDQINFDYIINNEYAIKIFDFKNSTQKQSISTARSWALAAQEVTPMHKVVFIYSHDMDILSENAKSKLKTALAILNKYSYKTLEISEGASFISSITNNQLSVI